MVLNFGVTADIKNIEFNAQRENFGSNEWGSLRKSWIDRTDRQTTALNVLMNTKRDSIKSAIPRTKNFIILVAHASGQKRKEHNYEFVKSLLDALLVDPTKHAFCIISITSVKSELVYFDEISIWAHSENLLSQNANYVWVNTDSDMNIVKTEILNRINNMGARIHVIRNKQYDAKITTPKITVPTSFESSDPLLFYP
jgi:hypothetical protein